MKFKADWDITAYDGDVFLGLFEQEYIVVDGKDVNEALEKAKVEAGSRFAGIYGSDDYSIYRIRKLTDENNIEYLIQDSKVIEIKK